MKLLHRLDRNLGCGVALAALLSAPAAWAQRADAAALNAVGRTATPAEVHAWNIDVRGDFKGLPKGSGSVDMGGKVWDGKCASCHGAFGESNSVFTPLVGGTSKKDIETGHVYFLSHSGYPHRTALMKVSRLSTLWDYINRAMPWTAPKSLTTDEVYGVLAYILNLGDIVPADFTLSDKNIAEVQKRLPNRNGHVFYKAMWEVRGKGDVKNPLCMKDCPVQGGIESALPDDSRNANGNIAEQVRPFGPARGTDTSLAPRTQKVGVVVPATVVAAAAPAVPALPAGPSAADAPAHALIQANACTSCHGVTNRIVGPAFQDVATKYAGRADVVAYLSDKIRSGGQGVWGAIPMPAQAQLKEADARAIAQWLAAGAK
ncbi:MAG: c-type cytochrome [Burkholderiales bacterium]|nr:c-type cytochrome [Burkholderiales bacterium]MDE2298104.1 c-type cytochrome [Burkholderiales bacterium]MDE2628367.1 c-type cytochrome [Burkholderiales bacterium]